jgi:hypothetical protein
MITTGRQKAKDNSTAVILVNFNDQALHVSIRVHPAYNPA